MTNSNTSSAIYDVIYWPRFAGRVELTRLVLEAVGVSHTVTAPEDKDFASFPFFQVPVLKSMDQTTGAAFELPQSWAIVRYLARKHGLVPEGGEEAMALADAYAESVRELLDGYWDIAWNPWTTPASDPVKAPKFAVFREGDKLKKFIPAHERILAKNGNGFYFAGNKLTYVELAVFFAIEDMNQTYALLGDGKGPVFSAETTPQLWKVHVAVAQHPKIKAYMASERYPSKW